LQKAGKVEKESKSLAFETAKPGFIFGPPNQSDAPLAVIRQFKAEASM
jgi:hypothetical protein